jgi:hypothetical protein
LADVILGKNYATGEEIKELNMREKRRKDNS